MAKKNKHFIWTKNIAMIIEDHPVFNILNFKSEVCHSCTKQNGKNDIILSKYTGHEKPVDPILFDGFSHV